MIDDCVLLYIQSSLSLSTDSQKEDSQMHCTEPIPSLDRQKYLEIDPMRKALDIRNTPVTPLDSDNLTGSRACDIEGQGLHANTSSLSTSLPSIGCRRSFDNALPIDDLPLPTKPSSSPYYSIPDQSMDKKLQAGQCGQRSASHSVFRSLEDYIINCFRTCDTLNESFLLPKPAVPKRSFSEGTMDVSCDPSQTSSLQKFTEDISDLELDSKTLLLGDVAENGGLSSCFFIQWTSITNVPSSLVVRQDPHEPKALAKHVRCLV